MQVVLTGASGLIGSALVPALTTGGHGVTRLVRSDRPAQDGEAGWDPSAGRLDVPALEGADAVVHLAGETVAGRWNDDKKRRIMDSRARSTKLIAETLAAMEPRPGVFVCASAIGYYGDRGDERLAEDSKGGEGFLADVVREWEAATLPAAEAGVRVVNLRFGIVLSPAGGALASMLTPFKLGAGGPFGGGRQYMSWIAIDDIVGAIQHALTTESLAGPVNATSPYPVTNSEFSKTLGRVLKRPSVARVPAPVLRLVVGEFSKELLDSRRVLPMKLTDSGYEFRYPQLETALRHLLGRPA
jgi:uncharacterized protein